MKGTHLRTPRPARRKLISVAAISATLLAGTATSLALAGPATAKVPAEQTAQAEGSHRGEHPSTGERAGGRGRRGGGARGVHGRLLRRETGKRGTREEESKAT